MNWTDFADIARVRALEDADEAGTVWSTDARRIATHDAALAAKNDPCLFLQRRSRALKGGIRSAPLLATLTLPQAPAWLVTGTWIAAYLAGLLLGGIGQEREINLLALPLMVILLWNVAVIAWSLVCAFARPKAVVEEPLFSRMLRKLSAKPSATEGVLPPKTGPRFGTLVGAVLVRRLTLRFHAWLHVGAALLALGSISAMYARGWSAEYRAVWESSLLGERGASAFFGALFGPASRLTGVPIPLGELPAMHRGLDRAASKPGEARPWIHLYAGTLLLFVIAPRLLLAAFEASRARGVAGVELLTSEWQQYARRLMSFTTVGNATARILVLGLTVDEPAQARWRSWLRRRGGDIGPLELESVKVGSEAEFAAAWQPAPEPAMLVINAALTPESEVHRELVQGLAQKLAGGKSSTPPLLIAVDDAELRKRWSGFADCDARLQTRAASWKDTLQGLPVDWI